MTKPHDPPLYLDHNRPVDERVNDIVGRMTIEEKIGQMGSSQTYRPEPSQVMCWSESLLFKLDLSKLLCHRRSQSGIT